MFDSLGLLSGPRLRLLESKYGLVEILRRYQVSPCEKTPIPMRLDPETLIITALGGLYLNISKLKIDWFFFFFLHVYVCMRYVYRSRILRKKKETNNRFLLSYRRNIFIKSLLLALPSILQFRIYPLPLYVRVQ